MHMFLFVCELSKACKLAFYLSQGSFNPITDDPKPHNPTKLLKLMCRYWINYWKVAFAISATTQPTSSAHRLPFFRDLFVQIISYFVLCVRVVLDS